MEIQLVTRTFKASWKIPSMSTSVQILVQTFEDNSRKKIKKTVLTNFGACASHGMVKAGWKQFRQMLAYLWVA